MNSNLQAFLDTIAFSEIGLDLLANSDNGYNVLVGGSLFSSYTDHPHRVVDLGGGFRSSAAGRYQILARYFDHYAVQLNLPDFSPTSQDRIAIQMISECHAIEDIEAGRFDEAIEKCRSRWASFPGANYNQPEHSLASLRGAYINSGGSLV